MFTSNNLQQIPNYGNYASANYNSSKAGMPVKSAHDIRRTVASLMHKVGIPIDEIRRFLGHVDEKTTWGYIFNQYSEKATKTMIGEALSRRTQVYSNQK